MWSIARCERSYSHRTPMWSVCAAGFIDTDMVAAIPAPKATPADVAKRIVDGLEQDAVEVLTDDLSINVKRPRPAWSSA